MPEFSVKKALTVFVAAIAVLILGVVAYTRMTPDLLPNMDFPYVIIMTTDPGASPEAVEADVTKPLEQSMATLDGIVSVNSNSADNYSLVILEFEEDTNLDTVGVDIQQKIAVLEASWDDMVGTPYVLKINPSMLPVAMAAVSMKDMDIMELSEFVSDDLTGRLEGITGVANVTITGQVDEQLHVVISQEKIDALNKKIAAAVNQEMNKAAGSLNSAKAQINNALSNIGSMIGGNGGLGTGSGGNTGNVEGAIEEIEQQKAKIQKLIDGLKRIQRLMNGENPLKDEWAKQVADFREEIALCQANIDKYNARLAVLPGEIEAAEAEKAAVDAALEALDSNSDDPAVQEQITQLQKLQVEHIKNVANLYYEKQELEVKVVAEQTAKAAVEEALSLLGDEPGDMTMEQIQAELDKLGLGISLSEVDAKLTELTGKLKELQNNIELLYELKSMIENTDLSKESISKILGQLTGAAGQLLQGVVTMGSAMAQIDTGLATIESSRNQALSAADLNNILSLETVSGILYAQNFSMPAGYVEQDGISYMVSVGDRFKTVEELETLMLFDLGFDSLDPIYLCDVADVFMMDNSADIYTRLNSENGIMLSFEKQSNYATAEVSENIRERFQELQETYPGLEFFLLMDQGEYIEYVVAGILESLLSGAMFSVVILLIFLKDIRPTFITLVSIPLSLMLAITLMYFTGITLNIISLAGLAISVGMLVDNSVVVIENIYRLRSKGANTIQAAVSGAKQVAAAITSSTLTTVCVFLPIVFVDGLTKQLFMDLALTMGFALMASLVVALTLVPAMASKMLKDDKPLKKDLLAGVYDKYRPAVAWCIDHKPIVLGGSLALLILSAVVAVSAGFTFMPAMDSNTVTVTVSYTEDVEMADAMDITDDVIDRILTIEEVQTVGATMGGTSLLSMGSGGTGTAVTMYVTLPEGVSGDAVGKEITELCKDLDCEISCSSAMMDMSMLTGSGVSISVYSNDMDDLQAAAKTLGAELAKVEGIAEVSDGLEDAATALHVTIDRDKAMEKGFTIAQIYMQLATNMTTSATATSIELDGTSIDVIVEQPSSKKVTWDNLLKQKFSATNQMGKTVEFTLADVAVIEETTSLTTINRADQQRYLTVTGTLEEGYNVTKVTAAVQNVIKNVELPHGVKYEFGGENEMIMDAMVQLLLMLLLGILLVYFIMVAQFQSLKSPFIVMFTIPLAFTGGFLALLITGFEVSIISMIGFIMLVGIIVNNGIVLVDYINQLRLEGMERREAILEAGVTRIRPILMTSLTTILGLTTMAMGKDMGTILVQPIAIVCIGGLLYATLMTLFVVPCIYDMVNKNEMEKVSEEDLVILDI